MGRNRRAQRSTHRVLPHANTNLFTRFDTRFFARGSEKRIAPSICELRTHLFANSQRILYARRQVTTPDKRAYQPQTNGSRSVQKRCRKSNRRRSDLISTGAESNP